MSQRFRCPFEIKGEADGLIIHIYLNENKNTRHSLIRTAFEKFHTDSSMISIKFHMPPSVLEQSTSFEELQSNIFPYQIEIVAVELEYRLHPFLPYQMEAFTKEMLKPVFDAMPYKFATALFLNQSVKSCGMSITDLFQLENWLMMTMLIAQEKGAKNPTISIRDDEGAEYMIIRLDCIEFHPEKFPEIVGKGNDRRNCFGIVTCPLYPEAFGRYSEDVTVVMSRMKDFINLQSEDRRKIRYKFNSIYQNHGVKIEDLFEDKQPNGLWIPEICK